MAKQLHTFHIPIMGLGYTVDTPVKVARFGISSVVSVIEDALLEQMREYYCKQISLHFVPISKKDINHRAKRITAYLDLLSEIVGKQMEELRLLPFEDGSDLVKYFELLPQTAQIKSVYLRMLGMKDGEEKLALQNQLRKDITPGSIDVNIMTKIDRVVYSGDGEALPAEYSDAMAALRGFAQSKLSSSVVLSAGLNPRLYAYLESFEDFYPGENGQFNKSIILKVSDYRSALIQGKFLGKKGLWVSEYRVESGLNCGGHAFATDGLLLGPILEEFKNKRKEFISELGDIYNQALLAKGHKGLSSPREVKISVQGGIGTAKEDKFLQDYYFADSTGWGSPFLLVPEVTNVDDSTLQKLVNAKKEDYYLSYSSPLGIPFNNFRKSSSELQRKMRIKKGRPGSPCYKKFLSTNTEFTDKPICTASRQYQHLKLKQLMASNLPPDSLAEQVERVVEKDCLCEGLGAAALLKDGISHPKKLEAVAICPGPNLAYFSKIATLEEMVSHIYGRINLLNQLVRPNMFVNELNLYLDYFKNEIRKFGNDFNSKQVKRLDTFKMNLMEGIDYYKNMIGLLKNENSFYKNKMMQDLLTAESVLTSLLVPQEY
jgi:hypothetical protein